MKVRTLIAQLAAIAERVPGAEDLDVRVAMCDGTNIEITRVFELDTMTYFKNGAPSELHEFLVVKAHPHLDDAKIAGRAVAEDADEHLRRWTDEG